MSRSSMRNRNEHGLLLRGNFVGGCLRLARCITDLWSSRRRRFRVGYGLRPIWGSPSPSNSVELCTEHHVRTFNGFKPTSLFRPSRAVGKAHVYLLPTHNIATNGQRLSVCRIQWWIMFWTSGRFHFRQPHCLSVRLSVRWSRLRNFFRCWRGESSDTKPGEDACDNRN